MLKRIIKKAILHFTNPILAVKFDLRKLYYLYGYIYLTIFQNIKIPKSDFLIKPDFVDLMNLYKLVLKYKPKNVVEVGSGYSTIIILKALQSISKKYNFKTLFYSMEQDEDYLNKMKRFFNEEDKKILKFVKTDLVIEEIENERVSICKNFPNIEVNMYYEDRADNPDYKIAGDSYKIEKYMPKEYLICVDGMQDTVNYLKKNLKRKYKISGGFFHGTNFIPNN